MIANKKSEVMRKPQEAGTHMKSYITFVAFVF